MCKKWALTIPKLNSWYDDAENHDPVRRRLDEFELVVVVVVVVELVGQ